MASVNRAETRRQSRNPSTKKDTSNGTNISADVPVVDQIQDAIVIKVIRQDNGSVSTAINIVGDVRITEIETLLRIAQKAFINNSSD